MLKLRFKKMYTPFRRPFTTAYETKQQQAALLVAIVYDGHTGIGEAPIISYYDVTMEGMIADLQDKAAMIERYAITEPARFWHFCHHLYPENPFLVCALDLAYWDMYCKLHKQSIASVLGIEKPTSINTFYTLAMGELTDMKADMAANPWPYYKVKVSSKESIDVLEELMSTSKSQFAVDANASWTLEEAETAVPKLQELGVLFVEQALAIQEELAMKNLKESFDIPFFADESFQQQTDIEKCNQTFDGINIKLTKCGGLSPAFQIIQQAKEFGLKTMLGCMNETEYGIYPAAQLGGLVDYSDLDGAMLLQSPLQRMQYRDGKIILDGE